MGQVIAGGILEGVGRRPDNLAGGQHYLQVEDIIAGGAVFYGFRATAAVGQVATQGAAALAGRVRRIKQTYCLHRVLKRLVHHARLHGGLQVALVNLDDFIESLRA